MQPSLSVSTIRHFSEHIIKFSRREKLQILIVTNLPHLTEVCARATKCCSFLILPLLLRECTCHSNSLFPGDTKSMLVWSSFVGEGEHNLLTYLLTYLLHGAESS